MTLLEDRIRKILETIERVDSVEELCSEVDLAPMTIFGCGVRLPKRLKPWRYQPEIDTLIDKGYYLPEMKEVLDITEEGVRQKIWASGQYHQWRGNVKRRENKKRKLKIQKEQLPKDLISILKARAMKLSKGDWVYQRALEYDFSRGKRGKRDVPLTKLIKLFSYYKERKDVGERASYCEIGEQCDLSPISVGAILRKLDIESQYWNNIRHTTPKEKKEAIKRGFNLEMSPSDIAHFLELPSYLVDHNFRRISKRKKYPLLFSMGKSGALNYRTASQIYEYLDEGYGEKVILEDFAINPKILNHAIENRETIEKDIINALNVLYLDRDFDKPYLYIKTFKKVII